MFPANCVGGQWRSNTEYLGLWVDPELNFKPHIDFICKIIYGCLDSLYRSVNCFSFQVRKRIISQLLLPILDYADVVYQNTTDSILKPLNILHNSLCRFVWWCPFRTHHCNMYEALKLLHPKSRRQFSGVLSLSCSTIPQTAPGPVNISIPSWTYD